MCISYQKENISRQFLFRHYSILCYIGNFHDRKIIFVPARLTLTYVISNRYNKSLIKTISISSGVLCYFGTSDEDQMF